MAGLWKTSASSKIQTDLVYKAKGSNNEKENPKMEEMTRKKYRKKILNHVADLIDSASVQLREEVDSKNVPIMHLALEKKIREDLISAGSYNAEECNLMAKKLTAFIEGILNDSLLSRSSSNVSCSEKEISGTADKRNSNPRLKYSHYEKKSNQIINIQEVEDLEKSGIVPLGNAVQYDSKNEGKFEVEDAQMGDKIVTLVRKGKVSPLNSFVRECSTWMIDVTDIHSEWSDWTLKKEKSNSSIGERAREDGLLRESTSCDLTKWSIPKRKESVTVKQSRSTDSVGKHGGSAIRDWSHKEDVREKQTNTSIDDYKEDRISLGEEMEQKSGHKAEAMSRSKHETKSSPSTATRLDKYIEQIANLSRIHQSQIDRLKGSLTVTTDAKRSEKNAKGGTEKTHLSESNENFRTMFMTSRGIKEGGSSSPVGPVFYTESKSKNAYHSTNCLSQLKPSDSFDGQ